MRLILTISFLIFSFSIGFSQEKFRIDYNHVAVYYSSTQEWGEWAPGDNTFIININERGDVAHLKANGETSIYRKLEGLEEGYSTAKDHYQIISVIDDEGDVLRLQLFDDKTVGLKLIYGDGSVMIQFAWF
jgi:hypothetical protein